MDATKEKILLEHIQFKKTTVKSEGKLKDIERYVSLFLNSNNQSLDEFNENILNQFVNSLHKEYSISSINDIKIYVKVFIKWYFQDYSLRFRNLDKILRNQTAPPAYTAEQMIKVDEFEKLVNGEPELYWKVYFLIYFYGGFRPSEACRLKWSNIFFEKEGTIIKGEITKTKKVFFKSLPENATHFLKEWRKINQDDFLFPSIRIKGGHLTSRGVYHRLKKLSFSILNKKLTPYTLRHSLATIKYNDPGLKDDITANQLGHSKSMKSRYMRLDSDEIKKNARLMWAKPSELPPEKKHELETKVEEQQKIITQLSENFIKMHNLVAELKNDVLKRPIIKENKET